MYLTCITHLSKIFNFLSSGNYSSLDVNFFRFSFSLGGGEGGNRREPQAEQPRPLKEILEDVKSALRLLSYPDPKYNYNKYKYLRANRQSPQKTYS